MLSAVSAFAVTIHIPGDYPTIQAGINAAVDGDTVLVAAGAYFESIDFLGKEIVVKSASGPDITFIDPNQPQFTINFVNGEGRGAVIEGFTITNSYSIPAAGALGGVYCSSNSAPVIRNNIISENGGMWATCGGIFAIDASPLIEKNEIINNQLAYNGGGICIYDSCENVIIADNYISGNYVYSGYGVSKGGGIYMRNSTVRVEGNIIAGNSVDPNYAYGGGITIEGWGNYEIVHNTISGNEGMGVYISEWFLGNPEVTFVNNIMVNTPNEGGIVIGYGTPNVTLDFNDVWNNDPFNYSGISPGQFDISADPEFTGGPYHNFYLNENSPCIDAGSFVNGLDPDGTRADIGSCCFNQEGINVAVVPDEWPINVPPGGGDFSYTLHLTNNSSSSVEFDIWVDALLPDSVAFGPILLREGLVFNPYQSEARQLCQQVPPNAPAGTYIYRAHTGDYSSAIIYHETSMPFRKEGMEGGAGGWDLSSTTPETAVFASMNIVNSTEIDFRISPNPFNPETIIRFGLRAASFVELLIYDIQGREVARLAEGWHPAGIYERIWNASEMASGVYFAHLQTDTKTFTQKLILLK